METREYFEKVMQDYNQNRNGRSLRKYCKDEAIDYNWLLDFKKTYSASKLDDEKGFKAFLTDGAIELSNNAAERMFRHIAMGLRRSTLSLGLSKNWLHIGSHMAAQNVAFMYSLYESCRLNNINFGKYLNDILTRMMKGDTNYMTMLPCNYVAQEHEDELKVKECA